MVGPQGGSAQPAAVTRFSADGFWWWDGAEWRPALSQDRLWRWNGQTWVPARPGPPAGAGPVVGLTVGLIAAFVGIMLMVSLVVIAILLTMGNPISNVFSTGAAALG